ncbi:hypothetical protein J6590_043655 [Homalodisca vitripennis]|nr:hypothetical protein J6590_043655 [Homalodisca vitripennis]
MNYLVCDKLPTCHNIDVEYTIRQELSLSFFPLIFFLFPEVVQNQLMLKCTQGIPSTVFLIFGHKKTMRFSLHWQYCKGLADPDHLPAFFSKETAEEPLVGLNLHFRTVQTFCGAAFPIRRFIVVKSVTPHFHLSYFSADVVFSGKSSAIPLETIRWEITRKTGSDTMRCGCNPPRRLTLHPNKWLSKHFLLQGLRLWLRGEYGLVCKRRQSTSAGYRSTNVTHIIKYTKGSNTLLSLIGRDSAILTKAHLVLTMVLR